MVPAGTVRGGDDEPFEVGRRPPPGRPRVLDPDRRADPLDGLLRLLAHEPAPSVPIEPPEPVDGNPMSCAFAWALVLLDGADVPMLHAVDVDGPADLATGDRVRVRWAEERSGSITDIACFEPLGSTTGAGPDGSIGADGAGS